MPMNIFNRDKTSTDSGHINVIALITAKPGKEAEVRALLEGLVVPSRGEDGCKGYHLHVDRKHPTRFYTYEEWTSDATLDAHLTGAKALIEKAMPILEAAPEIIRLDHLV